MLYTLYSKIPKMLFKNTDYLKLKYFAFALERIFTCVNIFSHSMIFLPRYPSNPYKLHLPERKTESCHIHFWTNVLMFSPTFLGRSVFLCISYVSPSAYVCVCECKSESVLMLSAWVNAFTQPPAVHAGTLQDDATAISVNKNRSCLGWGHQNHEVQCRRLYKNMN